MGHLKDDIRDFEFQEKYSFTSSFPHLFWMLKISINIIYFPIADFPEVNFIIWLMFYSVFRLEVIP